MTTFYFVRHGQTLANASGLKQGQINTENTELNETGIQQVTRLAEHFDLDFAQHLVASPLNRTQQTAALLNKTGQLSLQTDERLLEISYGQWDGKSNQKLMTAYPDVFDDILHDVLPQYVKYATEGETFEQVVERVQIFLDEMTKNYPTDNIVVVTHGFTIKAVIMATFGITPATIHLPEPGNASMTKLTQTTDGQKYLHFFNQQY
ncbi:histidine phosphatase family protein [Weissella sagaensis]|jgi:probable phosphoglycerate mutase|uniref:Histidine phosphatase family protein n=1 Tax=Weissella sagaensis TaxID=2559928 RepID=A0ABW1RRF6_9LACO|nr:histidine phosphatase family protein [Weissella sagaensis]KAA8435085.1 histidine phosphatase family protein [Weissella paramesenteroides]MBU7568612.1 histidine phosphatase family protein [Weissella hellenica]KAA8438976.1 histidine phosphatase family protein [Weissella paramesenteroides]QDJ58396.1 histidine phosphatase family protein [Weissella hellenica]QEA57390.1 histidine phosphatase family protein [Weissella hellenica]